MKTLFSLLTLTAAVPMLVHADAGSEARTPRRGNKYAKLSIPSQPKAADAKVNDGPFVTGDFLYWIASEEGLEYAVSGVTTVGAGTTSPVAQGRSREPNFNWDPGFRLGIGYTIPNRNWDVGLYWTRFDTTTHDSFTAATPISSFNTKFPTLDPAGPAMAQLQSAASKLKLQYNALDLMIGREWRVNEYFSLRPSAGLRGAWINQHYRVTYASPTLIPEDPIHRIKLDNDFSGLGIRTAFDAYWECHRYFTLFAKAGMTLFHGWVDTEQTYKNVAANNLYGNVHDDFQRVMSEFDTALGFRIQLGPCGALKRCEISAAYEYVLYPKQNQLLRFLDDQDRGVSMRTLGDLSFQGISVGASLYF